MKTKALLLSGIVLCFVIIAKSQVSPSGQAAKTGDYEVAVYYFPNYHPDSINARWHGKGWTEWELVKAAKPRFKGHEQPKVPSWGYFNEADPKWAAKEIDLAVDNGITCFIYDWYWYSNTGQYLQEGLEQGFLKAPNRNRLKFAIMWANHDWLNIQPATYDNNRVKLTDGKVSWPLWDTISTYIVENYFKQPNYWKIDGKPYFSIYEIVNFINGLGGIANARRAIDLLDAKAKKAGFPGVHFNIMSWQVNDGAAKRIDGPSRVNAKEMIRELGCQSVSSYCFVHQFDIGRAGFPTVPYAKALEANEKYWKWFVTNFPDVLYTPNVSMGWDASPRCMQSDHFGLKDYPWTPVLSGNTPEAFKGALADAKKFLDEYNPRHKIIVLNAWNEWTEGSYLLPEKKYGDAYLKAIKEVFGVNYRDNRPRAYYRINAADSGIILRYGDGKDSCDTYGAREAIVNREGGTYYLFYDGAGKDGWLACLAESKDLKTWTKKGPILTLGRPGTDDSKSASAPWIIKEKATWHMFYLGTPNTTPAPDRIPSFPYLTMKAKSKSIEGPWIKQYDVAPFPRNTSGFYTVTASPGFIVKDKGEYLQFFSGASEKDGKTKRTLGIARTRDLNGSWKVDSLPIFSSDEQVENSSLYFDQKAKMWFLFTNHIGINKKGKEYTDAVWMYWSKDINKWNASHKAIVLDSSNCTWAKGAIGMPSVIKVGDRLALFYDAPEGNSIGHMKRNIGLAWLALPIKLPEDK